jgi:hypothetical protein
MSVGCGYDGKYGPISGEYQKELKEQQEKQLGAEAVEFWRTEKEKARSWVRGKPPLPKSRIRLKKTTP